MGENKEEFQQLEEMSQRERRVVTSFENKYADDITEGDEYKEYNTLYEALLMGAYIPFDAMSEGDVEMLNNLAEIYGTITYREDESFDYRYTKRNTASKKDTKATWKVIGVIVLIILMIYGFAKTVESLTGQSFLDYITTGNVAQEEEVVEDESSVIGQFTHRTELTDDEEEQMSSIMGELSQIETDMHIYQPDGNRIDIRSTGNLSAFFTYMHLDYEQSHQLTETSSSWKGLKEFYDDLARTANEKADFMIMIRVIDDVTGSVMYETIGDYTITDFYSY